ncbi:MAG: Trk system potassium transporter TrkH [Candidatus Syntrophoarchaeum caldarius]|uniref:Trk system potassium transporter TrkH n=1 Tax=Candidatus Syntropharchaeum caldarium TaxID=1838285 RepID=A0A1F2P8W6_9EURY|nr:MAG: Trk system potassium transporter TrkH [Candidatus Syntrophoarchaeum caldarius]
MNYGTVFNVIGKLLMTLGVMMLLPLAVAIYYGERASIVIFAVSAISTTLAGVALSIALKYEDEFGRREGFAIVALGWLVVTIFGAIPYLLFGLSSIDALFESMAGFTTTGSTILIDIESYTQSFLFWRSLTQWMGGMGIIVLVLAIAPGLAIGGRQLFQAETPGPSSDKLTPRLKATAEILWIAYVLISVVEMVLLYLAGLPLYDAVTTTFSTMATGGFSPRGESIMAYHNPVVEMIVMIFMFIAGANFALHYRALLIRKDSLIRDREFQIYAGILIMASLLIAADLTRGGLNFFESLRLSTFQAVSIMTTTGFATTDFNQWGDFSRTVLFLLMFIGGCAGSTGGAIKVMRVSVIVKHGYMELFRMIHPRVVKPLRFGRRIISADVLRSIFAFIALYILAFVISTLILAGLGIDLVSSLSASATTLGNVGPGFNLVGPMENFAGLPAIGKLVLLTNMWIGRLEVITVLVLFTPEFWKK